MKKILLVLALVAIIGAGTAFADHPDGWGVGIVAGYNGNWYNALNHPNVALSLKIPKIPIYWAFNLEIHNSHMGMGLRGDYYLLDKTLVPDIGLHWYIGLGGWVSLGFYHDTYIALGVRLPIGISWQLGLGGSLDALELFLEIAPSLGIQVSPDIYFPAGGWGAGFGVRLWF